ncbi:MAG: retroviral-like aspartic protease family protein [Paludibacteraceae bacterium]|nr:retroviral-like aspartic protease family protein [Paludibacteraceae bacterium]
MKKGLYILLTLLLVPICISAQKVIEMENADGVYKISCSVNGAKMKMIFDTGATTVSLSMAIANYLFENDYINKDDIIGTGQSHIADGSIKDNVIINIRDIEISGLHLQDVRATVIDGQNVPLLLGLSAIQKLGPVTINGNQLIINEALSDLSEDDVEKIEEKVAEYIDNGSYYSAIEAITQLENSVGLTSHGYNKLTHCYFLTHDMVNLINACKRWLKLDEIPKEHLSTCYDHLCTGYYQLEDYKEAIKWAEKRLLLVKNDLHDLSWTYFNIASCYYFLNDYRRTKEYGIKALETKLNDLNKTQEDILKGEVQDENLKWFLYSMGFFTKYSGNTIGAFEYFVYAAMMGDEKSINECREHSIDYRKGAKKLLKDLQ